MPGRIVPRRVMRVTPYATIGSVGGYLGRRYGLQAARYAGRITRYGINAYRAARAYSSGLNYTRGIKREFSNRTALSNITHAPGPKVLRTTGKEVGPAGIIQPTRFGLGASKLVRMRHWGSVSFNDGRTDNQVLMSHWYCHLNDVYVPVPATELPAGKFDTTMAGWEYFNKFYSCAAVLGSKLKISVRPCMHINPNHIALTSGTGETSFGSSEDAQSIRIGILKSDHTTVASAGYSGGWDEVCMDPLCKSKVITLPITEATRKWYTFTVKYSPKRFWGLNARTEEDLQQRGATSPTKKAACIFWTQPNDQYHGRGMIYWEVKWSIQALVRWSEFKSLADVGFLPMAHP